MHAYTYMHVQMSQPTYINTASSTETRMQIIILCGCTEFLFNPTFPDASDSLPRPRPLQLAVSKHPWHCRDLEDCGQRDGHKAHWGRKIGSNWEEEVGRVFSLTPCVPASPSKRLEVYRKDPLETIKPLLTTCFYVHSAPTQKGHIHVSQHSHEYWNINM